MSKKKLWFLTASVVALAFIGFGVFYFGGTASKAAITKVEAEKIISSQYPGTIDGDIQKDQNDNNYIASIEHQGAQYEIKIHGKTGDVIELKELSSVNKEDQHVSEKQGKEDAKGTDNKESPRTSKENSKKNAGKKVVINEEKATELALEKFSGSLDELELDEDDGRLVYEVKIVNGEDEAEITIDAFTGEILFTEIERED
ncbi:PepSY domain-containing protein [Virgibacillus pantothenticus]|uniref:PepSY domain-containing protein n=1 Tax=Virgibacillus pantothenticus TaxID=1473 RepID=UPI00147D1393|nr:PepSY domain-containing protein [Virgibacillus pantothenticus]